MSGEGGRWPLLLIVGVGVIFVAGAVAILLGIMVWGRDPEPRPVASATSAAAETRPDAARVAAAPPRLRAAPAALDSSVPDIAAPEGGPSAPDARAAVIQRPATLRPGRLKVGMIDRHGKAVPGEVVVDGRKRGWTPLVLRRLRPGTHRVVVRRKGLRPLVRSVQIKPGKVTKLLLSVER